MRSVLCFGDSNTWGHIPGGNGARLLPHQRWPGVMQSALGEGWHVVEEGLSGRTTVNDDPVEGIEKNGRRSLRTCLDSHKPLDLVILMLGTNDIKARFNKTASEIGLGIGALVDDIKSARAGVGSADPEILVVAPAPILENLGPWTDILEGGREKSLLLAEVYKSLCQQRDLHFFDASRVVECSPIDGTHLGSAAHATLGTMIASEVRTIFGG